MILCNTCIHVGREVGPIFSLRTPLHLRAEPYRDGRHYCRIASFAVQVHITYMFQCRGAITPVLHYRRERCTITTGPKSRRPFQLAPQHTDRQGGLNLGVSTVPSTQGGLNLGISTVPSTQGGLNLGISTVPSTQGGLKLGIYTVPSTQGGLKLGIYTVPSTQGGLKLGIYTAPPTQTGWAKAGNLYSPTHTDRQGGLKLGVYTDPSTQTGWAKAGNLYSPTHTDRVG